MSDSRIATIRKSVNIDPSQILLPFVFLNEQFSPSEKVLNKLIQSYINSNILKKFNNVI